MAKITNDIKEKILADWKVGVSQNQLAKNYNFSKATINKICKDVEQTNIELVNTKVSLTRALQEKSEQEVNSIEREVNDKLRRETLVYGFQEKAIKRAGEMLEMTEAPQDLKHLVDAVDKASITLKVSDRHAPKTEINNTNATQNNTDIKRVTIARRSDRDD